MLKIYGIKNCSSMKKAFDLLNELNLPYEFHDYKKLGIDKDTLKVWLEELGQDVILNKKGTTWKKLSPEQQATALENTDNLLETLSTYSSMIKRPVLHSAQGFIVGFDEEIYRSLK
ncbi:Spx/MgsR family transcriptional regulator [Acinetobacter calcoaceticus]|uniref:Spx/MgsR family transcriptional regulator n=1 Tax=Acinetobacter calcoaceticus TaxID=471 RepID=A0A4R1Y146_ACICA|nr:Spx/MgsR family transcriptional regulator [Acinetobacter calcoaceticus]